MKVRPVYTPLSSGPTVTRIFTPWGSRVRDPSEPMQIELHQTQDIGQTTALFAIRYTPSPSDATTPSEIIIVNGHRHSLPASAAAALRTIFDNAAIISGLTAGWAPWFWMDCICINPHDPAEREKQAILAPYIYSIAKWTLDCTGPRAQIKTGTNPYQSAVVNFGGPINDIRALGESVENACRVVGHVPGNVVWTESR